MRAADRPAVLVVEDEPDNADLMVRALRQLCTVDVCPDAASALQRLGGTPYLAVITDQVMPGMPGVELLEQVTRLAPQAARILVSGHADAQVLSDAINRGSVEHFLAKPIEVAELTRLIARLCQQAAPTPTVTRRALVVAAPDAVRTIREALASLGIACEVAADPAAAQRIPPPEAGYELLIWDTATVAKALDALVDVEALARGAALLAVERPGGDPDSPKLLAAGVDDVIWRPLRGDELVVRIRRVLDRRRLIVDSARLRRQTPIHAMRELIGQSRVMAEILDTVERVASSDATVLIRGETGTGKELVARVIHSLSLRRERPFVTVNCAALPESLVESELFGHERGAFTGATARRLGRFERADGGTLLIDEVGDVPLPVQVKILRALQERAFERVGGNDTLHVDIRLIGATNRNLEQMIEDGRFREDLFYRLNVVPITVPPLRDRVEDIWPLCEHYLGECQRRIGKDGIRISARMRRALEEYPWPGNVRELINVVERAVALTPARGIADLVDLRVRAPRERALPVAALDGAPPKKLKALLDEHARRIVAQALERNQGNRTRTARELGLSRQALAVKLAKFDRTIHPTVQKTAKPDDA